jgi:hypothetical protein
MEVSGQLHELAALALRHLSNKRPGWARAVRTLGEKKKIYALPEIEPLHTCLQSLFRVGYPHYDNEWHRTHAHAASPLIIQIIFRYMYCDESRTSFASSHADATAVPIRSGKDHRCYTLIILLHIRPSTDFGGFFL